MRLLGQFYKLFTFFYNKVLHAQKAQKAQKRQKRNQAKAQQRK